MDSKVPANMHGSIVDSTGEATTTTATHSQPTLVGEEERGEMTSPSSKMI